MKRSVQMATGNVPRLRRPSRSTSKPRHQSVRFRAIWKFDPEAYGGRGGKVIVGYQSPIVVRSLASVGGPTRRKMAKRGRIGPLGIKAGMAAFQPKIAEAMIAVMKPAWAKIATLNVKPRRTAPKEK